MVQEKEPNVIIQKSSDGINDLSLHADEAVEDRDPVDTVNAGGDGEQTSSSAELIIQTPLADFTGF